MLMVMSGSWSTVTFGETLSHFIRALEVMRFRYVPLLCSYRVGFLSHLMWQNISKAPQSTFFPAVL